MQVQSQQKPNAAEQYYQSDNAYRFYNICNGEDYTGMGRYPDAAESQFEDGTKYIIGAGATVEQATRLRDDFVLNKILANLKDDFQGKKLRILELGSGRGGMSRNISLALKEKGMLGQYVCCNITPPENAQN